jgi:hypothetical protein
MFPMDEGCHITPQAEKDGERRTSALRRHTITLFATMMYNNTIDLLS